MRASAALHPVASMAGLALAFALAQEQRSDPDRPTPEGVRAVEELGPEVWLKTYFARRFRKPFAFFHSQLLAWFWALVLEQAPANDEVLVLPRAFGKSTVCEGGCAMVAARRTRGYALYISRSQDLADDRVQSIGTLFESRAFGLAYPDVGARSVSKYGHSRAWRRNRLWTASGFVVDAMGLDTAIRGVKVEDDRPDLIILDDLDDPFDSDDEVARKKKALQRSILPAGSDSAAILVAQNLVREDGVVGSLVPKPWGLGDADYLATRKVFGPYEAVQELRYEEDAETPNKYNIVGGRPIWPDGYSLDQAQRDMHKDGLSSFLIERQHRTLRPGGGLFDHIKWERIRVNLGAVPVLTDKVVAVDPAGSKKGSAHQGIQVDGKGIDGKIYRLFSYEERSNPRAALRLAIEVAIQYGARRVIVETDYGGELWEPEFLQVSKEILAERTRPGAPFTGMPVFVGVRAGSVGGKIERAQKVLFGYERNLFRHVVDHVGSHLKLEAAYHRFPLHPPLDLVDASVWSALDLIGNADIPAVETRKLFAGASFYSENGS